MKKKLIFLCITTLCVLLVACVAFAACDPKHPAESGFKVTLDFNGEQGDVTLSKPAEGELYDTGEEVTVTVTPKEGWLLDTFTVSGFDDAALNGGGYTFDIQADTTVTVTFKKATFTVSLTATPADGGTAELSPKKDIYEYGDEVTLTMTPASDNVVRLTVNDQNIELTENEYKFTVKENLTISVAFVDRATAVLESLQGSITFEGQTIYVDNLTQTTTYTNVYTTFDSTRDAVLMEKYDGTKPLNAWLFKNSDGDAIQVFHDMKGKVTEKSYGSPFKNFANPFDYITLEHLVKQEDGKWTIVDTEEEKNDPNYYPDVNARQVVAAIMDATEKQLESFVMTEENGRIVKIEIVGAHTQSDYGIYKADYQYSYVIEIKNRGTAAIDSEYFEDYKLLPEHEILKNAMLDAADATSYTVTYESNAENYTLYYTSDGIYIDGKDEDAGYFARPDGNVWEYHKNEETNSEGFDSIATDSLSRLKSLFEFSDDNGEYYMLLKSMGDGQYSVRPVDITASSGLITAFYALQLATGLDEIYTFDYAKSFAITLKDGMPSVVDFYVESDAYDYTNPFEPDHIKLTFSDWNTTTLPYTIPDNIIKGTVDKSYSGVWATEDGQIALDINLDRVLFNNEDTSTLTAITGGGYSFSYDKKNYSIVKSGDNLALKEGTNSYTLYNCPWYMYIGTFLGVRATTQNIPEYVDIDITVKSIQIKFGVGQLKTAKDIKFYSSIVNYDGEYLSLYHFEFSVQGDYAGQTEQYILQQYAEAYYSEEEVYDILIMAPADSEEGYPMYRDKYQELDSWTEFVGTFSGEGYEISISNDKIEIADANGKTTIAKENIVFYSDYSYTSHINYNQFMFTYNNKECYIEPIEEAVILSIPKDSSSSTGQTDYELYHLMDTTYTCDYSAFYGTYDGELEDYNYDFYSMQMTIEEDGTVKVQKEDENMLEGKVVYAYGQNNNMHIIIKMSDGSFYNCTAYPEYEYGDGYVEPKYLYVEDENGFSGSLYFQTDDGE